MSSLSFNTLDSVLNDVDLLIDAGVPPEQAKVHIKVIDEKLHQFASQYCASRIDLRELDIHLNSEMKIQGSELRNEMQTLRSEVKAAMNALHHEVKTNIDWLRKEVKTDIDSLRKEVKVDVESLRKEVKNDIDSLRKDVRIDMDSLRKDVRIDIDSLRKDVRTDIDALRNNFELSFKLLSERGARSEANLEKSMEDLKEVFTHKMQTQFYYLMWITGILSSGIGVLFIKIFAL